MQIKPVTNDIVIPKINIVAFCLINSTAPSSNNCKIQAPRTTGADKQKENFAALSLSTFKHLALAIVVPLREKPGIRAKTCEHPIIIASLNDISLVFFSSLQFLSTK